MVADAAPSKLAADRPRGWTSLPLRAWLARRCEALAIPVGAALVGFLLFGLFLAALGKSPLQLVDIVWRGGFGSPFALGNSLQRAAPLLFAALWRNLSKTSLYCSKRGLSRSYSVEMSSAFKRATDPLSSVSLSEARDSVSLTVSPATEGVSYYFVSRP